MTMTITESQMEEWIREGMTQKERDLLDAILHDPDRMPGTYREWARLEWDDILTSFTKQARTVWLRHGDHVLHEQSDDLWSALHANVRQILDTYGQHLTAENDTT